MRTAIVLLLATVIVCTPLLAFAQIVPPKPGVEIPQAYFDRVAQDKTAFQFQKAWIQKAQRAKELRELSNDLHIRGRASIGSLAIARFEKAAHTAAELHQTDDVVR